MGKDTSVKIIKIILFLFAVVAFTPLYTDVPQLENWIQFIYDLYTSLA